MSEQVWFDAYPEVKNLCSFLRDLGYFIQFEDGPDYATFYVYGKEVVGCFCTPSHLCYSSLNGIFSFDNEDCFDKWSKCPVSFDVFALNYGTLKHWLEFIGSDEGYKYSISYAYLSDDDRPYVVV